MPAREVAHLRLPIGVVGREFVQEDDRRSLARLLEIEADVIAGYGIGHLQFLLTFLVLTRFLHANREPLRLKALMGRAQKSQLMLAAAMRRDRFFFVTK